MSTFHISHILPQPPHLTPILSFRERPRQRRPGSLPSAQAQRRSRDRRVPCWAYLEELSSWRRSIWVWLGRVRNNDILLTEHMEVLATRIMEHGNGLPEGTPVVAKELLHLGSRAAVDQALTGKLVRRGALMRAGRGIYVRPVESRFGARPPVASKVVEAIAAQRGESVAPHGAAAANELGLTTQVPVREVYLTSGRSRRLKLGAQIVELRHVPAWQLVLPGSPAGAAIRALAWLGPKRASEALRTLQRKLSPSELRAVVGARGRLPTWMAQEVSALANNG